MRFSATLLAEPATTSRPHRTGPRTQPGFAHCASALPPLPPFKPAQFVGILVPSRPRTGGNAALRNGARNVKISRFHDRFLARRRAVMPAVDFLESAVIDGRACVVWPGRAVAFL